VKNIFDNNHAAFVNESFRTKSRRIPDATQTLLARSVRVDGFETRKTQSICRCRCCRTDPGRPSADTRLTKNPPEQSDISMKRRCSRWRIPRSAISWSEGTRDFLL